MKKIFLVIAAGFIPAMTLIGVAHAQNSKNTLLIRDAKFLQTPIAGSPAGVVNPEGKVSNNMINISSRAVRNFEKSYRGVTNAQWFEMKYGFTASFKLDGDVNRIYYDKRGNWIATIKCYDEKKMPHDVRATVKSIYYDYRITSVDEIRTGDKIVYLVHMQDATTWKNVKVCDGEMEVTAEFNKG